MEKIKTPEAANNNEQKTQKAAENPVRLSKIDNSDATMATIPDDEIPALRREYGLTGNEEPLPPWRPKNS